MTTESDAPKPAVILCVDDEVNVLKALRRLFHGEAYTVLLANSGAEALEIMQGQNVDLIISDMRMPQMDGAELLAKVFQSTPDTIRILLTGYADLQSTIAAVNQGRIFSYCNKPWNDEELKILVRNALEQKRLREEYNRLTKLVYHQNKQLKALNENLEEKVTQRTEELSRALQQLNSANNSLKKQYTESIKAFSRIIELRPGIISGHAKLIAEHAQALGKKLLLNEDSLKPIIYAALLLQIGKMSLPDEILKKPIFSLTPSQKQKYLKHATEAEFMLQGLEQLTEAVPLIKHQYEYFDGSGNPDGLAGGEIPIGSRILAVIQDYIACLEGSMTGQVMPEPKARRHLERFSGKIYDSAIVQSFFDYLDATANAARPVIEIPWIKLRPGMEVAEVSYGKRIYLKNCIVDDNMVKHVTDLWTKGGIRPLIKIRLGGVEPTKTSKENGSSDE